jgi:hypothetical protein
MTTGTATFLERDKRRRRCSEALLKENWNRVDKVATALLQPKVLSRAELLEVCEL